MKKRLRTILAIAMSIALIGTTVSFSTALSFAVDENTPAVEPAAEESAEQAIPEQPKEDVVEEPAEPEEPTAADPGDQQTPADPEQPTVKGLALSAMGGSAGAQGNGNNNATDGTHLHGNVAGNPSEFYINGNRFFRQGNQQYQCNSNISLQTNTPINIYNSSGVCIGTITVEYQGAQIGTFNYKITASALPVVEKHSVTYNVKYYKDGVLAETVAGGSNETAKTAAATVSVNSSLINTTNKYAGYKFQVTDPSPVPGSFTAAAGAESVTYTINVYYVKDTDNTHSVSVQVEYYYGDTLALAEGKTTADYVGDVQTTTTWIGETATVTAAPNTTDKFTGYSYNTTVGGLSYEVNAFAATDTTIHIVKVYYVKDTEIKHSVSAQVEYYFGDTLTAAKAKTTPDAADAVQTTTTWIGETATVTVAPDTAKYTGYTYAETIGDLSYTAAANVQTDQTVHIVKVYYVKNSAQQHAVSAQVEYYCGDTLQQAQGKLSPDAVDPVQTNLDAIGVSITLTVAPNVTNKFKGYTYAETIGDLSYTAAANVQTDAVVHIVKVYYVKDLSQQHGVMAQVQYYYGDTLTAAKAKTIPDAADAVQTKTTWIMDSAMVTVDPNKTDKFKGYKYAATEGALSYMLNPGAATDTTTHIVKVYYEKDIAQTHSVSAQVKYYFGDNIVEAKMKGIPDATEKIQTATTWIMDSATVTVDPNETNMFTGYKHNETKVDLSYTVDPGAATDTTTHIVNVYYVKDIDQTHSVSAQTEYYYGDTLAAAKAKVIPDAADAVQVETAWIGEDTTVTVVPNTTDKFTGYGYAATDGDLSYTVKGGKATDPSTHIIKIYYVASETPVPPAPPVTPADTPTGGGTATAAAAAATPAANLNLTPIEDNQTPLANNLLDLHCCILHFLIMLAALLVMAWYTYDMKKRQKRIFELEETLNGNDID